MEKFKSFMEIALTEAKNAARRDEVPVGAVIVNKNGIIVARAGNSTRELKDPTAHAEILTIRKACQKLESERLMEHYIYVTLQPCPMCLQAIVNARISRLYYGARDMSQIFSESYKQMTDRLEIGCPLEIYPNIGGEESRNLIKNFFKEKR